jgi:hypothetical protein
MQLVAMLRRFLGSYVDLSVGDPMAMWGGIV